MQMTVMTMQTALTPRDHFTARVSMAILEMESAVLVRHCLNVWSVQAWGAEFVFHQLNALFAFVDVNECEPHGISDSYKHLAHNCHNDSICTNTNGSFYCTCLIGYSGDGVLCSGK